MHSASWSKVVGFGILLAAVGCGRYASKPEPSLYVRLGGKPAITAVVGDFLQAVGNDGRVRHQPAAERGPALRGLLVDLVCQASGGPRGYGGRGMKAAPAGGGVSPGEVGAGGD